MIQSISVCVKADQDTQVHDFTDETEMISWLSSILSQLQPEENNSIVIILDDLGACQADAKNICMFIRTLTWLIQFHFYLGI